MTIPLRISVPVSISVAFIGAILAFLGVPNEQVVPANYPNVMFVAHTEDGPGEVVPYRFDGVALPPVSTDHMPGLYQHMMWFWHDRVEKFKGFSEAGQLRVWECIMFCRPLNDTGRSQLYLIHAPPDPDNKKALHQWWITEMTPRNPETPILYARTKGRKDLAIATAPWVEPDQTRTKPKPVPIVLYSLWDVLWPGIYEPNPVKWAAWVLFVIAVPLWFYKLCKDDDFDTD
ncbi:unnamed protein product [Amoebophrya sp. A120]|nr:unnamed protein product [Amoebophrya sp. A120]|eukprot:GSA120T00011126001.1